MAGNTDNEQINNSENTQAKKTSDKTIPADGSRAVISKQDTENTEVSGHPHHGIPKKKLTEYLLQFFMLFLAVYLGFVAENIRGHNIDEEKEKVYMQNMLDDLRADTAIYNRYEENNKVLFALIDTLIRVIKSPEIKHRIPELAYTARMILPSYKALYTTDRTYEQMKSSGDLRLISNKHVASNISSYYYSVIDLKKYNDAAFTWGSDYGKEMGKIFDAELLLKIIKENKEQPATSADLLTEDRTTLNDLATSAQYLYGAFLLAKKIGNERNLAAQKLIGLIKKEYAIADE